jgi:hypothetical protein
VKEIVAGINLVPEAFFEETKPIRMAVAAAWRGHVPVASNGP